MALEGKKVLVVGTGKSGIAATQLLLKNNVKTVLFDGNNELNIEELKENNPIIENVEIILGELSDEIKRDIDLFFDNVDYVGLFFISGGEPLLYPHIADIVQ